MEKRYQVFVSSTYEDLQKERWEVMQALLTMNCFPTGMELFPAADDDSLTVIKRFISECDYYIVIVAGRYGSVGSNGKSYTETEYDLAIEAGIPVLAFLHGDPTMIPTGATDPDEQGRAALNAFRKKIEAKRHAKFWTSPKDLAGKVCLSLLSEMQLKPRTGWIRADRVPGESAAQEILRLRDEIERLQNELAEVIPPKGAELLAQGDEDIWLWFHYEIDGENTRQRMLFTWNHLFAALVPLLLDQATEDQMRTKLAEIFENKFADHQKWTGYNTRIREEDFQRVKVQLLALGLIKKGLPDRSWGSTTWTLTSYGTNRVIQDAAIRSSQTTLPMPN